jgi:hypothetical protein
LAVTKKAKVISILPWLLAIYMVFMSFSTMRTFHPKDPARYMFGLPPLAIAVAIVGTLFYIPRRMALGKITVLDSGVEWDPGRHDLNLHFPWQDMMFSAPRNQQQLVRSLLIVHRDKKLMVYDFFVPDFDLLVQAIAKRKTKSTAQSGMDGIKIDSGRVGNMPPR